jgi:hypothetical protein
MYFEKFFLQLYRTFNQTNDFLTVALQKTVSKEILLTRKENQALPIPKITALKILEI